MSGTISEGAVSEESLPWPFEIGAIAVVAWPGLDAGRGELRGRSARTGAFRRVSWPVAGATRRGR
jgi:hypothetical protein